MALPTPELQFMQCFQCVQNQQNVHDNLLKILADIILSKSTDLKLGRENVENKL
jgi:hypothetical protein